ncbi:HEPN domain-containing protein [Thiospirochaeta perfilievii]|uniref:HEPN domain-containing protein n=1 Tax=Thiospirochaeta perfilievii TaxID=252967 RepID=UPI0016595A14|nr:HEPN domain-containing protein [Thiospirochaeta perfilievii]
MAEKFLKQYELLINKAKVDLKVAKNILRDFNNGDDELDLEVVMFHLQQSTEKILKSILDLNSIKFPRTHDIEELINLLKESKIDLNYNTIDKLIVLSDYAVEGRYGLIHDDMHDIDLFIGIISNLLDNIGY